MDKIYIKDQNNNLIIFDNNNSENNNNISKKKGVSENHKKIKDEINYPKFNQSNLKKDDLPLFHDYQKNKIMSLDTHFIKKEKGKKKEKEGYSDFELEKHNKNEKIDNKMDEISKINTNNNKNEIFLVDKKNIKEKSGDILDNNIFKKEYDAFPQNH